MKLFDFLTGSRPPLVEQSLDDMGAMLDTAAEMFAAATAYLLDNAPLTVDLSARDEDINAREQRVRRAVLEHMTIDPRDELALSLLIISVVQDAERCGDLAKSIAKAANLAKGPRSGRHVEALRAICDRVQALFPKARAAFLEADSRQARAIMEEHDALKKEVTGYLRRLAEADDLSVNHAVVLATAARMVGRVSSHLSNIISSVVLPFDQIRRSPTWGDDE
ncbi:MAG TPA: PhoU domain-containing protein [Rubricoccaceae bacterium]|nr:PhoU domain-containing protein [Rubricoccaceae bacterium]